MITQQKICFSLKFSETIMVVIEVEFTLYCVYIELRGDFIYICLFTCGCSFTIIENCFRKTLFDCWNLKIL